MRSSEYLCAALAATLCACADDEPRDDGQERDMDTVFEAQASRGAALYARHCAECHGESGEGDSAPPLVGLDDGALPREPPASRRVRKEEFVTAADVAGFAVSSMPPGRAGSLSTDEYLAILAFDLKANGITLEEELSLDLASELTIPR
jgi:mono/diheme cytochrome c family protein